MESFTNRTVLITGAASGIGAALADEIRSRGGIVTTTDLDGDVDRRLDVRDLDAFRLVIADIGVPDFLFVNAGISMGGPTDELTRAHWDHAIDVNLNGVVNGLLAVYPGMVERGSGHIVITASGAGLVAPPFVTAYATTKHAVVGLGLGLRPEAAIHGVNVSVLCPGAVETPILDRLPADGLPTTPTPPVTARQYLALLKQKPVLANRFARLAVDRVERNQAIIVVPATARTLWYLHRLSPTLVGRISRSIARRVDRELLHHHESPQQTPPARSRDRERSAPALSDVAEQPQHRFTGRRLLRRDGAATPSTPADQTAAPQREHHEARDDRPRGRPRP